MRIPILFSSPKSCKWDLGSCYQSGSKKHYCWHQYRPSWTPGMCAYECFQWRYIFCNDTSKRWCIGTYTSRYITLTSGHRGCIDTSTIWCIVWCIAIQLYSAIHQIWCITTPLVAMATGVFGPWTCMWPTYRVKLYKAKHHTSAAHSLQGVHLCWGDTVACDL